jgi:alpha-L-rhamnosidase
LNTNFSKYTNALPVSFFRKSLQVEKPLRRATAYASALGLYELRINGSRVGKQLLAPEWTSYSNRVQYQTYDITSLLRLGSNAVGAMVAEGWYAGRLMAVGRSAYGTVPKLLVQLELEFQDGSRQVVATDRSWAGTSAGPIVAAGIYDGEKYDARHEQKGWDTPSFIEASWSKVLEFPLDSRKLVWQPNEPIEIDRVLPCRQLTEPRPGHYVFNFDQNLVGWCRFRARGLAGQTVRIQHAEALKEDGTVYTANLRGAPQEDFYTPSADGEFDFEPHFTYHGFRYVEVTGLASAPEREAAQALVFHSGAAPAGVFECSDSSLNQLMHNVAWTERANLMSSPNDCPQRDERFGWMGDIQAFAQTAIFNMDLAAFLTKFAQDTRDDQAADGRFPDFAPHPGNPNLQFSGAPAWADAGVFVPWCAYLNYADKELLRQQFASARRWVEYVHRLNPDLTWTKGRNNDYNDWLNGDWIKQQGWPAKGGSVPNELLATAFFARSTDLLAKMAEALGDTREALRYRALFGQIRAAFTGKFVGPDGEMVGDTQGGYALALNFDLLGPELKTKAARHLVAAIHHYQDHLSTGIQTTHRAMLELTRNGYDALAWQLLTNRTFPSWLYMVDNGATTIWERWDGYVKGRGFQDPGMNSLNHWALGSVGEWMWRNIGGLNPDERFPGWKHFVIAPKPGGGVTWARAEYRSIRGPIRVSWEIHGKEFSMDVQVPVNTSATVLLPAQGASGIVENGQRLSQSNGIRILGADKGQAVLELTSGHFRLQSTLAAGATN